MKPARRRKPTKRYARKVREMARAIRKLEKERNKLYFLVLKLKEALGDSLV